MSRFLKIEQNGLMIDQGIPNVNMRNIIVDINKVAVNLSIKEKLDFKDPRAGWSRNSNILNNLKIKVILCFEEKMTKNIINKKVSILQDFNNLDHTVQQILSISEDNISDISSLFKIKDSEGNTCYDIPYYVEFSDPRITKDNPSHLSCIVVPYLENSRRGTKDVAAFSKIGKISSDIIFKASKLVKKSAAFYTKDGKVYAGSVHLMANGRVMKGGRHSSDQGYLKTRFVPNSKVQDHRIFDRIQEIDNLSVNSKGKEEKAQFSDIHLSRDLNENVRFLFGIDCKEIYRKNTKFSKLLDSPLTMSQIAMGMSIRSIKIFRQRIDEKNEGFSRMIVSSEDRSPRAFAPATYREEGTPIGSIEEASPSLKANASGENFRFFSVVDYDVSNHTDGLFEYRAEIKFKDNTREYLQSKTQQLLESYNILKTYLSTAIIGGSSPSSNRFNQDFIDSERKKKDNLLRGCIRLYIENLILFIDLPTKERDQISRTLMNMTHPISGNVDGVRFLMSLIEKIISKNIELLEEKDFLAEGKSTHVSTTMSTNPYVDIFETTKVYSRKEELYDAGRSRNTGVDYLQGSQQNSRYQGLAMVPTRQWKNRIAGENKKYLNSSKDLRLNAQEGNYNLNVQANQNTFVAPTAIYFGESTLDLQGKNSELDFMSFDASLAKRSETTKRNNKDTFTETATTNEENIIYETANFLNEKSVSLLSNAEIELINTMISGATDPTSTQEAELNVSSYIGEQAFFKDPEEGNAQFQETISKTLERDVSKAFPIVSQILPNLISNEQTISNESRNISDKASSIDKTNEKLNLQKKGNIIDTMSKEEIQDVPNQIMALTALQNSSFVSADPGEFVRNYKNNAEFNIRYNTLQRVEVLTGFGKGLKDPIWKPLTNQMDNAKGLLARMTPYSNPDLGVGDIYDLPAYNRYFFLGSPGKTAMSISGRTRISLPTSTMYIYPELLNSSLSLLESSATSKGGTRFKRKVKPQGITAAPTTTTPTRTTQRAAPTRTRATGMTGRRTGGTGGGGY